MRHEEDLFLKKISINQIYPLLKDGATFDELIGYFKNGQINLEMDRYQSTWVMSESLIKDISDSIKSFREIAKKPRSFIEKHDEKVLVESANKFGHKAISQLSRDSKDWYARTFVSVKPKNIVAEVSEETLNIYENRVFASLIRRLEKEISIKKKDIEEKIRKEETTQSSKDISNFFKLYSKDTDPWSFKLYKEFIWNTGGSVDNGTNELVEQLNNVNSIYKEINGIKASDVCKSLRKLKTEHSPIMQTNIFRFDKNYKKVIQLWKKIDQESYQSAEDVGDTEIDECEAKTNYNLYVLLSFLYAFYELGFRSKKQTKVFFNQDETTFDQDFILEKDGNVFQISIKSIEDKITLKYKNEPLKLAEEEYVIKMEYDNFEEITNTQDFDAITKKKLDDMPPIPKNKKTGDKEVHYLHCISFEGSSGLGELLNEKLARRILSFGDSFSSKESPENIEKWGNYNTGFINILPQKDFRNNLIKIERFLIAVMVKRLNSSHLKSFGTHCPICGDNGGFHHVSGDDYACYNCRQFITLSSHMKNSVKVHNTPFVWVKPDNTDFLQMQKNLFVDQSGRNLYLFYQSVQFVFGKYATTGFDIRIEDNKVIYKTICPKCGDNLE